MLAGVARVRLATLALLAALAAGCSVTWAPDDALAASCARVVASHPSPAAIVTLDAEGRFVGDRGPFVPRGIGSYPLLEHAGNGRLDAVDDIFTQALALGRPVLRTNAYLDGTRNAARIREADGSLREEGLVGLDRLLARAAERGVRLVLVLTGHWGHYGGAPAVLEMVAPGEGLPVAAFYADPRAIEAQRSYVAALVARTNTLNGRAYARDPTVLAWELVNEARCEDDRYCDPGTLVRWARGMAEAVRGAGARQLVAWGGAGHRRGEHGEDLEALAADGALDVLTLHVYPANERSVDPVLPAGTRPLVAASLGAESIRETAAVARRHGRALLVEELGWIPAGGGSADGERALVLGAWLRAARLEGVGALPWMIGEQGRPDYDGHLVDPYVDHATALAFVCE